MTRNRGANDYDRLFQMYRWAVTHRLEDGIDHLELDEDLLAAAHGLRRGVQISEMALALAMRERASLVDGAELWWAYPHILLRIVFPEVWRAKLHRLTAENWQRAWFGARAGDRQALLKRELPRLKSALGTAHAIFRSRQVFDDLPGLIAHPNDNTEQLRTQLQAIHILADAAWSENLTARQEAARIVHLTATGLEVLETGGAVPRLYGRICQANLHPGQDQALQIKSLWALMLPQEAAG